MESMSINTGTFIGSLFGEITGSGGNLTITADSLRIGGLNSFLDTGAFPRLGGGQGGNLTITAHDIQLSDFTRISASGNTAGAIRINADQFISDSAQFAVANVSGPSGGITITGKVVEFDEWQLR